MGTNRVKEAQWTSTCTPSPSRGMGWEDVRQESEPSMARPYIKNNHARKVEGRAPHSRANSTATAHMQLDMTTGAQTHASPAAGQDKTLPWLSPLSSLETTPPTTSLR